MSDLINKCTISFKVPISTKHEIGRPSEAFKELSSLFSALIYILSEMRPELVQKFKEEFPKAFLILEAMP